jgi:hypothetical protein
MSPSSRRSSCNSPDNRQWPFICGLCLPIAVIASVVFILHHRGGQDATTLAARGSTLLQTADTPCGYPGQKVSMTELQAAMPYQLVLPNTDDASPSSVSAVWQCSKTEAVIVFQSGASLMTDTNTFANPTESLTSFVQSDPSEATVGDVLGQTAAVIDPSKDPAGQALGSVTFVLDDTWVCLVGNGKLSADALVGTANSIRPLK